MNTISHWNILLQPERFRPSRSGPSATDQRNPFENDHARIILSAPFRRLQDKAQVFPLERSDFIRTRLTHSVEVSTFARGLGLAVEKELIRRQWLDAERLGDISSILATAGLIHDIGNPPFGHFGEEVIQQFFRKKFRDAAFRELLSEEERADFECFEGNAQGFRILRKLSLSRDEFSYNLTFPTLASVVKYPHAATEGNRPDGLLSYKKFGYFRSERNDFLRIRETLAMGTFRHPLVFLLEAADDIAYSVADIEDGCQKKVITREILTETLSEQLSGTACEEFIALFAKMEQELPTGFPDKLSMTVMNFRVAVQSYMLREAVLTFIERHDDILNGTFDEDLVMASKAAPLRNVFKKLGFLNFQHSSVVKRELAGEHVLNFLLDTFLSAVLHENRSAKSREARLYSLISLNYRYICEHLSRYPNPVYRNIQLVTDFISGMTDSYALDLYHELSGQRIG